MSDQHESKKPFTVALVVNSSVNGGAEQYLYDLYRELTGRNICRVILIGSLPGWPLELGDTCAVYPPGVSTTSVLALSWAEELVPKLLRQDAGETDLPFYYVMLHNGRDDASGHFDGTTTTCR